MVQTVASSPHFSTISSPSVQSFSAKGPYATTRPPTPPRDSRASDSSKSARDDNLDDDDVPSTPTTKTDSVVRNKKSVNWSPWTTYHKSEDPTSSPLAPVRPESTPLKSILKPFKNSPVSLVSSSFSELGIAPHTHASFPSMLESITQALASSDRSKKLDTYITFSNTLKAYDVIPDIKAVHKKISLLSSYIKRDLTAKLPASNNFDTQLVPQAIKLLTIFGWMPQLADALDDQDVTFFLLYATQIVQDPQSPKVLVTHFLHFLGQQKFAPRLLSVERANSILNTIQNVEDRVSGNSVLIERISIYHKLITQARSVMVARAPDWMDVLLAGLISSNKEMRSRSMACISEAARYLGTEKPLFRGLTMAFNRDRGDGERTITKVAEHLTYLVKNGEGVYVAQVWGQIILLLRGRPHPLNQWEHFSPWLGLIQHCFNSSSIQTKVAANSAWSKLIYVLHSPKDNPLKDMELISKPLARYLDPQNASSNSKVPRQAALSNISTLLYHSLRPGSTFSQLSFAWDTVVVRLIEKLVLYSRHEVDDGCKVLEALFDGSYQKMWNEPRCLDKEAIKPEEVPRFDPKWVRSNCATVLKTLETALRRSSWLGEEDASIRLLWRKFTKTLAEAGSKEIKVSAELMEAVAHLFNMFQRIWLDGPQAFVNADDKSSDEFVRRVQFLVTAALDSIGAFCFTEKQLAYDDEHKFVAVSTPSNRFSSGSLPSLYHPPIVHLFQLFLKPFDGAALSKQYYTSARIILSSCSNSLDSRRKHLALFACCVSVLPPRDPSTLHIEAWKIIAGLVEASLPLPTREKSLSSPAHGGWELREVLKILQWGCSHSDSPWRSLFDAFAHTVQTEQGEAQVSLLVVEPIAETLRLERLDTESHLLILHGKTVLDKATFVKHKPVDLVRSPFNIMSRKNINSEPFDNLYDMINQFLLESYPLQQNVKIAPAIADFFGSLADLIDRCPAHFVQTFLRRIQDGVACWTMDSNILVPRTKTPTLSMLILKIQDLWDSIFEAILRLPKHDSLVLQSLTTTVASALESNRKGIVTKALETWNSTFGTEQSLEYPARIRIAMKKLRPISDILLPTFPEDIEEIVSTPPVFLDSQDSELGQEKDMEKSLWSNPSSAPSLRNRTKSPSVTSSNSFLNRLKQVPMAQPQRTTSRPKHMDSQITFAPIKTGNTDVVLDSQLLTDHQREVRERQNQDAILFPEIRITSPPRAPEAVELSDGSPEPDYAAEFDEMDTTSDEFVDAPEEIPEPESHDSQGYMQEVEAIPSTIFAVEIPVFKRQYSPRGSLKDIEGPKDEQEHLVDVVVSTSQDEIPDSHIALSAAEPPIRSAATDSSGAVSDPGKQQRAENSVQEMHGASPVSSPYDSINSDSTMHDSGSVGLKGPAPKSNPTKYVLEVPDSYVHENDFTRSHTPTTDHLDIFLNDTESQRQDEQPTEPDHSSQIPNEKEGPSEPALEKIDEGSGEDEEDVGTPQDKPDTEPAPKRSRRRPKGKPTRQTRSKKRKSSQPTTNPDEQGLLDCIVISKKPGDTSAPPSPIKLTSQQRIEIPAEDPSLVLAAPSTPTPRSRKRKARNDPAELLAEDLKSNFSPSRPKRARTTGHARVSTRAASSQSAMEESDSLETPKSSQFPDANSVIMDSQTNQDQVVAASEPETETPQADEDTGVQEKLPGVDLPEDAGTRTLPELPPNTTGKPEDKEDPLQSLEAVLAALESTSFGPEKLREAEDMVFDAYYRIREKRRSMFGSR